ncbi:hypothetical protein Q31b_14400 [Novipirellula aureliae]|uniref:Uncharacterized protein n=1 Tax=Novipirellula aureliae TaxID=2527966 RepID=A0A5C6E4S0_9BACT|nr:hypothetical protein [Novipirellula aureliae]TWU43908.1 hypothetical protein Q31b_14400 [Novipirellula aureliae]
MITSPPDLNLASQDGSIQVCFRWHQDRYQHHFGTAAEMPLMTSIEDNGGLAWPCSPPIQQLSLEAIPLGDALLGVGGAGTSHWSISVHHVASANQPTLQFELACRYKIAPGFLGSRYDHHPDLIVTAGDDATLDLDGDVLTVKPKRIANQGTSRWSYQVSKPLGR